MISLYVNKGYSYNRPVLSFDSTWHPNGTTVLNETLIGFNPSDMFINQNNTIYVPNQESGDILVFLQGNFSLMQNISVNLINSSSLFVTKEEKIYIDTFYSSSQCCNENQTLYCSLSDQHQVIAKSLLSQWDYLLTIAGTGTAGSVSTTLRNPKGIFLDEANSTLFVADCGNNRVLSFRLDSRGYLFVVDSNNHRIIGQSSVGFRCIVGCDQSNSNKLNYPSSLSFDSFGNLFVVDRENHRIQKFDLIIYSGQWKTTGNMTYKRMYHAASILSNGNVLVDGGWGSSGYLQSAEVYDSSTGIWTTVGNMNVARSQHTASVLLNGKVLAAGGSNGSVELKSAELYNPATSTWSMIGNMNTARAQHTASILTDGTILIAGGCCPILKSAELYNISTNTWTITGSMNVERRFHTASVLSNGKVLVAGGQGSGSVNSTELYDPSTGMWTITGNMSFARNYHTASILSDNTVLVTGGIDSNPLNSAELYG
ncbi:unnamed protein product [Adineta ricciae]|uniref:Uncharacterized protein n=1 Tax=Adineta ricciae TaxID=249248 RepID=A0A816BDL8_ADIRI|nr:unnamed protein product [Adineta ricciae]